MTNIKAYPLNVQLLFVVIINGAVVATVFLTHNLFAIFVLLLTSKWCML